MKDYMKNNITKIADKFAVKSEKFFEIFPENFFWELSKEVKAFSHVHAFISLLQQRLFDRACIYQDLTLCLSYKPKLYYRYAGCKL